MNWALIGYGGMGHWHVGKVQTMPELFNIAGIYDIKEEVRAQAEKDGLKAYPTLEALLDDPSIDLVTIATPNNHHKPIAIQALKAGKNVISEKPVTMSSDDLQAMIDAAEDAGKIFSVHQNRRWDEDFLMIKKLYDENALGKVFNIESRVHGSRSVPTDWRGKKRYGGGMILDWGVHMLDQLLQIVKEDVISVYNINSHVTNKEIDDGFRAQIIFASGITALVEVGTSNFVSLPRWYMQGENGTTIIHDFACNGETIMVSDWENRDAVPVITAAGLTKTMAPRTDETIKHYPLPAVESDVRDYYRNIKKTIEGSATQIVTHHEMLRVVKLMEALQKSADLNEVIHTRI